MTPKIKFAVWSTCSQQLLANGKKLPKHQVFLAKKHAFLTIYSSLAGRKDLSKKSYLERFCHNLHIHLGGQKNIFSYPTDVLGITTFICNYEKVLWIHDKLSELEFKGYKVYSKFLSFFIVQDHYIRALWGYISYH